ncbi:MAG: hypothetical protein HGB35_08935 [Geobacteraceae bacterium]|nr:hypothetical protein [Geobacteraceae bacterium]
MERFEVDRETRDALLNYAEARGITAYGEKSTLRAAAQMMEREANGEDISLMQLIGF